MKRFSFARLAPAFFALALLGACSSHGPMHAGSPPAAAAPAAKAPTSAVADPGARQAVVLKADEHKQVLTEMNEFLNAVHAIQLALANKDFAAASRTAQAMGPRGGQHDAVGERLHQKLPEGWFALARPTHQQFLAVARAAQTAKSVDEVMRPLADTTRQCVACHATYRLELAR